MDLIINGAFTLTGDPAYLQVFGPRNRALSYAEGAFESLALKQNAHAITLRIHLDRWQEAARVMGLEASMLPSTDQLQDLFRIYGARRPQQTWSRVRMQFCRKPGGLYTPATRELDWWAYFLPMDPPADPPAVLGSAAIWPEAMPSTRIFPHLKLILRGLELGAAAAWAAREGVGACLLQNQLGNLCGAVGASLVLWEGENKVWTPLPESGALQGVTVQLLRGWCEENGILWEPGERTAGDLERAQEIWLLNAVQGVRYVDQFKGRKLTGIRAREFQKYWLGAISREQGD